MWVWHCLHCLCVMKKPNFKQPRLGTIFFLLVIYRGYPRYNTQIYSISIRTTRRSPFKLLRSSLFSLLSSLFSLLSALFSLLSSLFSPPHPPIFFLSTTYLYRCIAGSMFSTSLSIRAAVTALQACVPKKLTTARIAKIT